MSTSNDEPSSVPASDEKVSVPSRLARYIAEKRMPVLLRGIHNALKVYVINCHRSPELKAALPGGGPRSPNIDLYIDRHFEALWPYVPEKMRQEYESLQAQLEGQEDQPEPKVPKYNTEAEVPAEYRWEAEKDGGIIDTGRLLIRLGKRSKSLITALCEQGKLNPAKLGRKNIFLWEEVRKVLAEANRLDTRREHNEEQKDRAGLSEGQERKEHKGKQRRSINDPIPGVPPLGEQGASVRRV
jgi:hypothetical protein